MSSNTEDRYQRRRDWVVRPAEPGDADQVTQLFYETIHRVNCRDYDQQQLEAWAPAAPDPQQWRTERIRSHQIFVADDQGTIAGFGELEADGHIDCFYCHHHYQRRGVGRAIYEYLETVARQQSSQRLFVEASVTARPFFESMGFHVRKSQIIPIRGVGLRNFVMEKHL